MVEIYINVSVSVCVSLSDFLTVRLTAVRHTPGHTINNMRETQTGLDINTQSQQHTSQRSVNKGAGKL